MLVDQDDVELISIYSSSDGVESLPSDDDDDASHVPTTRTPPPGKLLTSFQPAAGKSTSGAAAATVAAKRYGPDEATPAPAAKRAKTSKPRNLAEADEDGKATSAVPLANRRPSRACAGAGIKARRLLEKAIERATHGRTSVSIGDDFQTSVVPLWQWKLVSTGSTVEHAEPILVTTKDLSRSHCYDTALRVLALTSRRASLRVTAPDANEDSEATKAACSQPVEPEPSRRVGGHRRVMPEVEAKVLVALAAARAVEKARSTVAGKGVQMAESNICELGDEWI